MTSQNPTRLLAAEKTMISQLNALGAIKAAEKLARTGLPTRRVEAYHYTDLKALIKTVPQLAASAEPSGAPALDLADAFHLLMINGHPAKNMNPPAGLDVSLEAGSPLSERDDVLVLLNRSLVEQRLKLGFNGEIDQVILVDRRSLGNSAHCAGALEIELADGASACVVEVFSGTDEAHLGNQATRVTLGKGARLTHIVANLSAAAASHFHTIEYDIAAAANLRSLAVNSGSVLSRTQIFALFDGEDAHGDFSGLNLVDDGQHCDITLDVTHALANTSSSELYKSVARNRAKAVFQGRIVVAKKAQKTDAKMMAQGLMLSEGAQILCKPELEIFADDVQCGHGATCGELDAGHMFYLMSRGIGRSEAAAILIRAFIYELFDPIAEAEIKQALGNIVENWLDQQTGNKPQ
ncbi:Iron-sulfur cluster assembly protein SufD [hydrothermal vent metagenome]|uniref:Iron-sulfur cluster assembly protein SufD n=1 Tax=hydrothermal vent metagenome TaxID=652676 RepID=A0A3B0U6F5_9ZZZZ